MEELSLDEFLASNLEFQSWIWSGVSGSLVSMLSFSDVLLEFMVKFVEICDKITCTMPMPGHAHDEL